MGEEDRALIPLVRVGDGEVRRLKPCTTLHCYVHLVKSSCEGDAQCCRTTWKVGAPQWWEVEGV